MKKDFKLEELPKSTIYPVPADYFDKLPRRVMARVATEEPEFSSSWWSSVINPLRAGLASFILTAGFITAFVLSQAPTPDQNRYSAGNLSHINQQEALEYVLLQDNIENLDLAELNLTDQDVSAEFINATPADIIQTVDEHQLEEIYYN